ncbi:glycosyltransferase family 2 protein [soil metagenome]
MNKAVIINPTYNEKGNIDRLITVLEEEVIPTVKNWEIDILVVDDNSPDGTQEVIKALQKKYHNLHLLTGEKEGLGAAYIRGMTYAVEKLGADVMFEMDADFFHDPKKVPEFLQKIDEGYDFVVGTRYSGGGSIPSNWAYNRKFLSVVGNFIVRSVFMRFSIHDWTGGYRAIRKEVFIKEKAKLSAFKGYRFQVGFLHKAVQDKFKIAEVPFHATDREMGRSKMARSDTIVDTLKYVFYARFKELERFMKFLVVGGTGFLIQVIVQELVVYLGAHNEVGVGFGAESAILSNFTINHFWTFSDTVKVKQSSSVWVKLAKFNITSLGSIVLQVLSVYLSEELFGEVINVFGINLPTRIVVLFPTIIFIVIPLNYLIYNRIIWKTQYLKHGTSS